LVEQITEILHFQRKPFGVMNVFTQAQVETSLQPLIYSKVVCNNMCQQAHMTLQLIQLFCYL